MTEAKEVKSSGDDIPHPVGNDPINMKKRMVKEKDVEEKEEKLEEEEEQDEDDEEEEDDEDEDGNEDDDEDEDGNGDEDEDGREHEDEDEEDSDEETDDSEEVTEDENETLLVPRSVDVSIDGEKVLNVEVSVEKNNDRIVDSPIHGVDNSKISHADNVVPAADDGGIPVTEASVKDNALTNEKHAISNEKELSKPDNEEGGDMKSDGNDFLKDRRSDDDNLSRYHSSLKVDCTKEKELKDVAKTNEGTVDVDGGNPSKPFIFDTDTSGGGESGTEEEQITFMMELDTFHKERSLEFKPPKFYGEPLNLLKLWRSVMRLGGYDKVTACKFWRQVGESFKPPKTCTTVSWTFRIFYEKALLDYERYRTSSDGSSIRGSLAVPMSGENQASGSIRARRDAAARCMQGWHSQRILDNGEVTDPIIKDKNSMPLGKKEKQLKNLGMLKRKNPSSTDHAVKSVRTKFPKSQTETTVIDIGSPADWVKINVRETKDCYEVYALVPGLLREEVRVQSDPAGRLVISGEPENPDNPWSVTPFKKVVSLPSRIDPHQTSAVVTLHGQLFVRVPFEQYD